MIPYKTEEEAAKSWCRHARVAIQLSAVVEVPTNMVGVTQKRQMPTGVAAANRIGGPDAKGMFPPEACCIGSRCMHWDAERVKIDLATGKPPQSGSHLRIDQVLGWGDSGRGRCGTDAAIIEYPEG